MEKGAEQVAAQRAADQEYHRRRRSDAAVLLFPYATYGEAKSVTAIEYYCCWRLMQRDGWA